VDVIALRPPQVEEKGYSLNGVQIHTLPIAKKRGSSLRYVFEYLAFFVMAFVNVTIMMMRRHYKVIDINTLPDFLVFAAFIPRWLGAKILLDMHEVMPEFYMSKFGVEKGHWLISLIRFQERLSMRFADHVLTINEPIQKLLESRGLQAHKATILVNSADDSLFAESGRVDAVATSPRFVVMYHGTLTHIYGLDIALNAFSIVQNEMPDAEFWIVGDGPEKDSLEHLVERLHLDGKVRFVGMVPQQEIPKWLDRCDVGVLPTRKDIFLDLSFSNKLPEYVIKGKPVIVSHLKAIRHYFSDRALAYFEPHNPSDLSQQMLDLYRDSNRRVVLAEQAKKEYASINWSVMKRRYLNVIKEITAS